MEKLATLRAKRGEIVDKMAVLADSETALTDEQKTQFDTLEKEVQGIDDQIGRIDRAQKAAAASARPVDGQDVRVPAQPKSDRYEKDKTLVVGGALKMLLLGGNNPINALAAAKEVYGERHPVTDFCGAAFKALITSSGPAGGFVVPPDYVNEIIELLRPMTVVRKAGPRVLPMPRGTMTIPKGASPSTAFYGSEAGPITVSKPSFGQVVASFKKLTALVPVSNDMLRYADPAIDAYVRDDLVQVLARREDLAFIRGDGTADSPKGFRTFVPAANVIASADAFSLTTVTSELGGAVVSLTQANVPMLKPVWIMHPRTLEYLWWVQNANGFYVFRDELEKGNLRQYPYFTTTQIPTNLSNGTHGDCSEIYFVDILQAMILDSMAMQLAVSQEAYFIDESGSQVSAFQSDLSLIRAITEHDFQMRHDEAIAVLNNVRWQLS
jgi:HK97 family phage major capsid protein